MTEPQPLIAKVTEPVKPVRPKLHSGVNKDSTGHWKLLIPKDTPYELYNFIGWVPLEIPGSDEGEKEKSIMSQDFQALAKERDELKAQVEHLRKKIIAAVTSVRENLGDIFSVPPKPAEAVTVFQHQEFNKPKFTFVYGRSDAPEMWENGNLCSTHPSSMADCLSCPDCREFPAPERHEWLAAHPLVKEGA